jgi:hypothetical protein
MTPNKEKAFRQIFRILKPGGRMSICTSVVKMDLKKGVKWPLCMRMFIHVDQIIPLCKKIGFSNIKIDDTNSLMQYDLQPETDLTEEEWNVKDHDRSKSSVHTGTNKEFEHLKNYDMNELTARVIVYAEKSLQK